MPIWTLAVDDSFTHADTSVGGAGSTTGVPTTPTPGVANGWTDVGGNKFSVSTNELRAAPTDGSNAWVLARLDSAERGTDMRVDVDYDAARSFPAGETWLTTIGRHDPATNKAYWVMLRANVSGSAYAYVWPVNCGLGGPSQSSPLLGPWNAAHANRVRVDFVGTSPTTITVTFFDLTTGLSYSWTTTDSQAGLQQSGAYGVSAFAGGTGIVVPIYRTRYQQYQGSLSAGVLSPNAASTTATAVALSMTPETGGTAPVVKKLYRSNTSNFTPGVGTLVATVSGLTTYTDSSPGGSPGDWKYYKIQAIDSSGSPQTDTSPSVATATKYAAFRLGVIGDSRYPPGSGTGTVAAFQTLYPQHQLVTDMEGVSGTSSYDWRPGASVLTTALAAFASSAVTHVLIELGANDSRSPSFFSAATYGAQISAVANAVVAAGYKVILSAPPGVYLPNASGTLWTDVSNDLIASYAGALDALCNGTTILKGDRHAQRVFMEAGATNYGTGDVVHFSAAGVAAAASLWAANLGAVFGLETSPGVAGGGAPAMITAPTFSFVENY